MTAPKFAKGDRVRRRVDEWTVESVLDCCGGCIGVVNDDGGREVFDAADLVRIDDVPAANVVDGLESVSSSTSWGELLDQVRILTTEQDKLRLEVMTLLARAEKNEDASLKDDTRRLLPRVGTLPPSPELPPRYVLNEWPDGRWSIDHDLDPELKPVPTREEAITQAWDNFREIDEQWHAWIDAVRALIDNSGDLPLDRIGLPGPVVKVLRSHGVQCMHALARISWPELLKMPGIGRKSLRKIEEALARHNLEVYRP
jgi:hypothetical protein